jgi:hypothetical protein
MNQPKRGRRNRADERELLNLGYLLDHVLAVRRQLENGNLPAERLHMRCGDIETPLGLVPLIIQTPYPALVQLRAEVEQTTFARFGVEKSWPEDHRALLDALQALVGVPIVCLEKAFMRVTLHRGQCVVTLGTSGTPGWTNESRFDPSVFEHLKSVAKMGGVLVQFASAFDRFAEAEEPEDTEPSTSWVNIRERHVAKWALTLAKHPRDRLILLLAGDQWMDPDEINKLNLFQVRQKYGRDYKPRVYLKKRLVRKRRVAEALLYYRQRDREYLLDNDEPMFRTRKTTRTGRSMRMGAKAIETLIERWVKRAKKGMPTPKPEQPSTPRERPPLFWVSTIEYSRRPPGVETPTLPFPPSSGRALR